MHQVIEKVIYLPKCYGNWHYGERYIFCYALFSALLHQLIPFKNDCLLPKSDF